MGLDSYNPSWPKNHEIWGVKTVPIPLCGITVAHTCLEEWLGPTNCSRYMDHTVKKSKETKIAKHPPRFLIYGAKMSDKRVEASKKNPSIMSFLGNWGQVKWRPLKEAKSKNGHIFAPYTKNLGGCFAIFVSLDFFTVWPALVALSNCTHYEGEIRFPGAQYPMFLQIMKPFDPVWNESQNPEYCDFSQSINSVIRACSLFIRPLESYQIWAEMPPLEINTV